ncbi:uncharacterized protein LOC120327044 isoform X2 [Styela clava]
MPYHGNIQYGYYDEYYSPETVSVERKEKRKFVEKTTYQIPDEGYGSESNNYHTNQYLHGNESGYGQVGDRDDGEYYSTYAEDKFAPSSEIENYHYSDSPGVEYRNQYEEHGKLYPKYTQYGRNGDERDAYYDSVGNVIHNISYSQNPQPRPPTSNNRYRFEQRNPTSYYTEDHVVYDHGGKISNQDKRKSVSKYQAKEIGDGYTRIEKGKTIHKEKEKVTREYAPTTYKPQQPSHLFIDKGYQQYPYQSYIHQDDDFNHNMQLQNGYNPAQNWQYLQTRGYNQAVNTRPNESLYQNRPTNPEGRTRSVVYGNQGYYTPENNKAGYSLYPGYRRNSTPHYYAESTSCEQGIPAMPDDQPTARQVRFLSPSPPSTAPSQQAYRRENTPEMQARLNAAASKTSYRDEFKDPGPDARMARHGPNFSTDFTESHKVNSTYYRNTDSCQYVQPTLLEYVSGRLS